MKKVLYISLLLACLACKTKTVTLEKTSEIEKISFQKHFDSLANLLIKNQLDYTKNQSLVNSSFVLESVPVLDSLGNRKPFNYKHYVDGKLAEEIYLEGGELTQSNETKQSNESEHKNEVKSKNTRIESDVGVKAKIKKAAKKKGKEAKTKGFQFGFYLWSFLLIVVLIVLRWIDKKFNLIDRLKTVLQPKGD